MTLWLVAANCGDYYCGCGVGHVIGAYTDKDKAEEAVKAAQEAQEFHRAMKAGRPTGETYKPVKSWQEVWIVEGETDGPVPDPMVDGHAPEWGTSL